MKNSWIYTALAAFVAFVGAAVYAVLYFLGFLPAPTLLAQTGIAAALVVLALLAVCTLCCCTVKQGLNTLGCFGKVLTVAAIITLLLSALLLILPSSTAPLYILLLFLTVFWWKFTLIVWGLTISAALPKHCPLDKEDCCTTANNTNTAYCAENTTANGYGTQNGYCCDRNYNY